MWGVIILMADIQTLQEREGILCTDIVLPGNLFMVGFITTQSFLCGFKKAVVLSSHP